MDEELDELKKEFLTEAEEKVREIETVAKGPHDSEALDRLAYLAHQLKGSGGSYGYQRISTTAADIEKATEDLAAGEGREAARALLEQSVQSLGAEIDRALKELTVRQ